MCRQRTTSVIVVRRRGGLRRLGSLPGGVAFDCVNAVVLKRVLPHRIHPLGLGLRLQPCEPVLLRPLHTSGFDVFGSHILKIILRSGVESALCRRAIGRAMRATLPVVATTATTTDDGDDEENGGQDGQPDGEDHHQGGVGPHGRRDHTRR